MEVVHNMADKKEPKLKETKGKWKANGIVVGLDRDNAYAEGVSKNTGRNWKRLRFGVQTSPTNTVYLELMGSEKEFVMGYNRNGEDGKKTQRFTWGERDSLPEGFHLLGVNVKLEEGLDGKLIQETFTEIEAVEYIYNNLADGDSVYVNGKLEFSQYENREGQMVDQTKFIIQGIGKTREPIDFDIPYDKDTKKGFLEVSEFEQDVVIVDPKAIILKKEQQLVMATYYIGYGEKFFPAQFVIRTDTHSKLAGNVAKNLKFGDVIKVYGKIVNQRIEKEVEGGNVADDWGSDVNGVSPSITYETLTELRVTGVDNSAEGWRKKVYKEEDFVLEEAVEEWGNSSENPFAVDSSEELPFDLN
jgi:hypothetical protein